MVGIDTNFLVALELQEHEHYASAHEALEDVDEGFAMAPQVVCEFLHAVTDSRRLKRPLPMSAALERAEVWLGASDVTILQPGPEAIAVFFQWMTDFRLGRKRILDTMLAATFVSAGVARLATINVNDFKIFGVFDFVTPRRP